MEFSSLDITASALTAQRLRMDVISGNLANVNTTRRPDGSVGAYRRKQVVFAPILNKSMNSSFGDTSMGGVDSSFKGISFSNNGVPTIRSGISMNQGVPGTGVQVTDVVEDTGNATTLVYEPGHPDANADGYVEKPNISTVREMVDMISATRAYESNLTVVSNFKQMFAATLKI